MALIEAAQHVGTEQLERVLRSHLLPAAPRSPLLADEFGRFLDERQDLIASQLTEVTRCLLAMRVNGGDIAESERC